MSKIQHVQGSFMRVMNDYVAQADLTEKKTVVVLGTVATKRARIAVAMSPATTGSKVPVEFESTWRLPKVNASSISMGDPVNWDVSVGKIDAGDATPASGDVVGCGFAMQTAGAGTDWIEVQLQSGGVLT